MRASSWREATVFLALVCLLCETGKQMRVDAAQERAPSVTENTVPNDPFLNSNGLIPPFAQYQGPLFRLNHDWPAQPLTALENPPWLKAIGGGAINTQNAPAYVAALKEYVGANAWQLLLDYVHWDAATVHWYNEPWLGSTRESIHGTYPAGQFGASIFPGTGLKTTFDTHVLTYYDERAAYTLNKVWGADAMNPAIEMDNFQFPEGSVIVKAAAFVSDDPAVQKDWWPLTEGAAAWPVYTSIPEQWPKSATVLTSYVMQFDIVVKEPGGVAKDGMGFCDAGLRPQGARGCVGEDGSAGRDVGQ